ncbi:MAG: class I tRNA ligase family protein, partial [Clostridia bacterium]|nr:class I tRNA ligase family protein [Clostridia bacterium]
NFEEEDLAVGVRDGVEADGNKKNKADFVLWFTKSKFDDQELKWNSPWGIGYPGWHIECSCIASKFVGEYLDIHCGGIDNAFPHHTNEIAQSEATFGHEWCKYWFHVHHLNTNSGKMSKSKGEFLTVSLLEEKGYDPLVYRFFCMQSHYRKNLVFSWENLDNAKTAYNKLVNRVAELKADGEIDEVAFAEGKKKFTDALDNDLNTSLAVTALYDVFKLQANDKTKLALVESFESVLDLGLIEAAKKINDEKAKAAAEENAGVDPELLAYITEKIEARKAAKKAKNFAEADAIRDELLAKGITLLDTREGTKFSIN